MKPNNMVKNIVLAVSLMAGQLCSGGGNLKESFQSFLEESYFRRHNAALGVLEYGLPDRIRETPSFTNLVTVISNEVGGCFEDWKSLATNDLNRALFRIALAEAGPDVYTHFVTNALDKSALQTVGYGGFELVEYMGAACTRLENYYMLNYDQPVVNNLWLRARTIFEAHSLSNSVRWVDRILSGEAKSDYLELKAAGAID